MQLLFAIATESRAGLDLVAEAPGLFLIIFELPRTIRRIQQHVAVNFRCDSLGRR